MNTESVSKKQKGNAINKMLAVVFDFLMKNLEFIPLFICLQLFYDAGFDWKYWVTIIATAFACGLSTKYHVKNNR